MSEAAIIVAKLSKAQRSVITDPRMVGKGLPQALAFTLPLIGLIERNKDHPSHWRLTKLGIALRDELHKQEERP